MARRNHAGRMSPAHPKHDKVREVKGTRKASGESYDKKAKKPEADDRNQSTKPALHMAAETGIAKRRKATVKRLSNKVV